MNVIIESGQLLPRCTPVFRFQKSALFNTGVYDFRISGIDGHIFHMAQVRRRGKKPLRDARNSAQSRKFFPGLTQIITFKKMRGFGSHIEFDPTLNLHKAKTVNIFFRQSSVPVLPGLSQVGADIERPFMGTGEQEAAGWLHDEGMYVKSLKRFPGKVPLFRIILSNRENTCNRPHRQFVRRTLRMVNRGPAMGQMRMAMS